MKNKLTIAAIICLIVAGACLIGVLYYAQGMSLSDSGTSSTGTASPAVPAQPAPLSVSTTAATSSSSTPVSIPISSAASAAQAVYSASVPSKADVSVSTAAASPGRYIKVVDGITYEVVTTPATQEQGLSGRSNVPNDYAMLFDFPKDGTYGFWMKDMLVPLDMIWVTDSGTIAAVDSDVLPSTYPGVLYPPIPIRYVLETRAGFAQAEGWHVGTVLQLPTV